MKVFVGKRLRNAFPVFKLGFKQRSRSLDDRDRLMDFVGGKHLDVFHEIHYNFTLENSW